MSVNFNIKPCYYKRRSTLREREKTRNNLIEENLGDEEVEDTQHPNFNQ